MEILSGHIQDEFLYSIGWTIFHSVWIGALVSLILFIALTFLGKYSARVRYNVSLGALAILVILVSGVFIRTIDNAELIYASTTQVEELLSENNALSPNLAGEGIYNSGLKSEMSNTVISFLNRNYSLISFLWLAGIIFMAIRFTGGLIYTGKLKKSSSGRIEPRFSSLLDKLKKKIGIDRKVEFIESLVAGVPMTTGWIKPVIYLPIGVLSGLPYNQVEAIIIHELAHIKRNDYLVNMFQSIIEIILFYHPAVWWISSLIRSERESACDDIAVEYSDEKISYIKALVSISELENGNTRQAVAFAGDSNNLLNRIKRIAKMKQAKFNRTDKWTSALMSIILIAGVILITGFRTESGIDKSDLPLSSISQNIADPDQPAINYNAKLQQDTTKLSGNITKTIIDPTDNIEKDASFTFKNGELTALTIEGSVIPESDYHLYNIIVNECKAELADVIADMEDAQMDIEEALKEIEDINMEEMEMDIQEALIEIEELDLENMELEIEDAIREIEEINIQDIKLDIQDMMIDIQESLREIEEIDMEEIEIEMQKAIQEIKEIDLENLRQEMNESLEGLREIDIEEIKKQMEKSMREIKESLRDVEINHHKVMEDQKENFEFQKKALEQQLIEIQEQEGENNKEKEPSKKKKKEKTF